MFVQDFVLNGRGFGEVASVVAGTRFDPGLLRPFYDHNTGRPCVTVNTGKTRYDQTLRIDIPIRETVEIRDLVASGVNSPVFNATTLTKQQWIHLDTKIIAAARMRLRAWADLSAVSSYGGFNGMAVTQIEHQLVTDAGEALTDMDGLSEGRTDRPKFGRVSIPLPIHHSSFSYAERELQVSRNNGMGLDTRSAEMAARRVAEKVEKLLIGTVTGLTYGDSSELVRASKIYGYTNFPDRITKTDLTTPTGSNAPTILTDILDMRDSLYDHKFYGPFALYVGKSWDMFLDADYSTTGGNNPSQTLRQRILAVGQEDGGGAIRSVRRLDFLPGYTMIMIQMTSDVAEAINGMDITTIQWDGKGGMEKHFKVMSIQVPRIFSDVDGNCGIVHATVA